MTNGTLSREDRVAIAKKVRAEGGSYREAGAAVGRTGTWAAKFARDGRFKLPTPATDFLVASETELNGDSSRYSSSREKALREATPAVVEKRWSLLEPALRKWRTDRVLPQQGTTEYNQLEQVKGLFKKSPSAWLFVLIEEREPWLLSHLVRWQKVRIVRRSGRGIRDLALKLSQLHEEIKRSEQPVREKKGQRVGGHSFLERLKEVALDEQEDIDEAVLKDAISYCRFTIDLASSHRIIREEALAKLRSGEMDRVVQRVALNYVGDN